MRLDLYLVNNNYAKTRSQASDMIKRGLVSLNGKIVLKTGYDYQDELIKIHQDHIFVSRAGEKLNQFLLDSHISLNDKIIVDIGSSTGGFTEVSLINGAKLVYAYDVGKDQMDQVLRKHEKVILNEETNILDVKLPNSDLILIDVSFTSIKPILNHLKGYQNEMICLIKPQFEAGNIHFKQGVLKDMKIHQEILIDVLTYVSNLGFKIKDLKKSSIKGKMGNQEYFLYIKPSNHDLNLKALIGDVL
jgi:23S rRNA (cytidine1920-2'-O)/16S rRNA (cytidine1409-2'-O)-methyltransferase